jgi:hypothetical protein
MRRAVRVTPAVDLPPNNWINRPALGGLGAFGVQGTAQNAIAFGNQVISSRMPNAVKAAIDASPLTAKQKRALKNEPLSFFIILGDFSADTLHTFIRRVQRAPGARPSYTIGGRRVTIRNRKGQNPAITAAEFLTVCNQNPVQAARIAADMAVEIGVKAPLKMTTAAVQTVAKNVSTTVQNVQEQTQQAANVVQSTAKNAFEAATSWIPGFGMLGDAGTVSGPTAAAAAGTGGGTLVAGLTGAQIVGLVTAAISLASVIVPPLLNLAAGQSPGQPTQGQLNEAANAAGTSQQISGQVPDQIKNEVQAQDAILGLPRPVAYGIGALLAVGGGALAYKQFKKR